VSCSADTGGIIEAHGPAIECAYQFLSVRGTSWYFTLESGSRAEIEAVMHQLALLPINSLTIMAPNLALSKYVLICDMINTRFNLTSKIGFRFDNNKTLRP
jgi:hypothetical protein